MYRDAAELEHEMYCFTTNNWSQLKSNKRLKEKLDSCIRKKLIGFNTKDSFTWHIARNTESTAVSSLKRERWGSLLVQNNKCQGEGA